MRKLGYSGMERLKRFLKKPLKDKVWSLRARFMPWLPLPIRLDFCWWLAWYDSTSHRIYHRCYEPNTQAFIRHFLRSGMVAFDVGSHHGFYTLLLSERTTTRFGYTIGDLFAFLEQKGYQVWRIPGEENAVAELRTK